MKNGGVFARFTVRKSGLGLGLLAVLACSAQLVAAVLNRRDEPGGSRFANRPWKANAPCESSTCRSGFGRRFRFPIRPTSGE